MSKHIRHSVAGAVAIAGTAFGLTATTQARPGPDVVYSDVTDTANHGNIGGTRSYTLGTATCNIGNQNLLWTNGTTPAVGFNMYRLHNGRLMQLGQGWCKTACCAAAGTGCGMSCNGQGGPVLGAGCRDVYGSGWNASQSRLTPRSVINPFTGTMGPIPAGSGDALYRRLQVPQADLMATNFAGALYFVEGVYVGTDDAQSHNGLNNASHRRVDVNQTSFNLTFAAATQAMLPAIKAWATNGLGPGVPDPSVNVFTVDVPNEGQFWVATKVTSLAPNRYVYDYAIFNINSHAAGGSLTIPLAPGVNPTAIGFHDVNYHSGEPYSNVDWINSITPGGLEWRSPQPFSVNPNSNALRWGTMYNYWFEATTAPITGQATLGLFRTNTPQSISFDVPVPGPTCQADWNEDGTVNSQDYFDFVESFFNTNADFNRDGTTNSQDYFDFVTDFFSNC